MKQMTLITIVVIASGLGYGYLLAYHPYIAQCLAMSAIMCGIILWIILMTIGTKKGDKPPQL